MFDHELFRLANIQKGIISKRAPHIPLKVEVDELFKYFKSGCYVRWYSNFDKAESEKFYFVIKDGDFRWIRSPRKQGTWFVDV